MDEPKANGNDSRSIVSMRSMELIVAALLFLFGATFAYQSYRIGIGWGIEGPQSGFFPFYVSLFVCAASITVFINTLRARTAAGEQPFVERGQLKKVLSVLIPAAIFILGVQLIGIYVSALIYIALFMRFLGHYGWIRAVVISVIISVLLFYTFEVWFQVPLYKGIWDATWWTGY